MRVLIVDDSPEDAARIVAVLERAGAPVQWDRVDAVDAMVTALERAEWDVVLVDHVLPLFGSDAVMVVLAEMRPTLPAVVVSGRMDEEAAAALVRSRAIDFVSKDHLARLPDAVAHALDAAARDAETGRIARELRRAEQRLHSVLASAGIVVLDQDLDLRYTLIHNASARFPPAAAVGQSDEELFGPGEGGRLRKLKRRVIDEDRNAKVDVTTSAGGRDAWYGIVIEPIHGDDGQVIGVTSAVTDISWRKRIERSLVVLAEHDQLTGLFNRRRMMSDIEHQISLARRYQGSGAALLIIDIDDFKVVNDTLGHQCGDDLLVAVARAIERRLRDSDVFGRLGGDEFGVLLPEADIERARGVAESLCDTVRGEEVSHKGHRLRATVSIGVAMLPPSGADAEDFVAAADVAMYDAKRAGHDRVVVAASLDDRASATRALGEIERLRSAIDEERLELWAQPVLDVARDACIGQELLLRLRDTDGSLVPPAGFIPSAERFGLIGAIDWYVVDRAVAWLAAHDGPALTGVNLSGITVGDGQTLGRVRQRVRASGVDPARLVFEITESAAIGDLAAGRRCVRGLHDTGCRSALDDFGIGFASFAYLRELPVDYVKIDGIFVRHLASSAEDRAIVKAITDISHGLGKQAVAEHVQSRQALAILREMGVDYAQGFMIGRPAPLDGRSRAPV